MTVIELRWKRIPNTLLRRCLCVLLEHKHTHEYPPSSCLHACSLLAHKWLASVRLRFVLSSHAPVCVCVCLCVTIAISKPNETNKMRHVCSALSALPHPSICIAFGCLSQTQRNYRASHGHHGDDCFCKLRVIVAIRFASCDLISS